MKLMYKTGPTKKIHESITKWFEGLSWKTVIKSYKNTKKNFDRMYKIFDKLDAHILEKSADEEVEYNNKIYTKRELVAKAKDYRDTAKLVLDGFLNEIAVKARADHIKKYTSDLYSSFWDVSFKDFWTKPLKQEQ